MELKPRNVNALIACRLLPAPRCPLHVRQPARLTAQICPAGGRWATKRPGKARQV
jgi:hypothetical protein